MKRLLIIGLLLVAGCSASAHDDRQEAWILDSLKDPVFQTNPDILLSKCFELSSSAKRACYEEYVSAKSKLGEFIDVKACEQLNISC